MSTEKAAGSYDVYIRRNADGLVHVYHYDGPWEEHSDYMWFEGNYACDCNRYLFFQRAADEPESDDRQCGETAYFIEKFVLSDGSEIPGDDEMAAEGCRQ